MKKIFYSLLALCSLSFAACSSDVEGGSGTSTIMVDLGADLSFNTSQSQKKAINESLYQDITGYTVRLINVTDDNTVVNQAVYSDWALAYQVQPGIEYKLEAYYGNPEFTSSYNELYVYGSETFTSQVGATKKVSFQCKPKAAKVAVNYSSDFTTYYKDCEVTVQTADMVSAETFSLAKANNATDYYIKAGDELQDVSLTFKVYNLDGTLAKEESKTVQFKAQTFLKINVSQKINSVEGGKFGINITVDNGITDENINIQVPNDLIN